MSNEIDNDKIDEIPFEAIDQLSDEEFDIFMNTGELPPGFKPEDDSDSHAEDDHEATENEETSEENESESENEQEDENEEKEEKPNTSTSDEENETFKKLFSKPIKANGSEFNLESMDEAISLIQKGAGYEAKMKKLKPSMKILKSLEKNSILEEDVNFLIDLHKGDKKAIKALLDKHSVESFELEDNEEKYTPNDNMISNKVLELEEYVEVVKNSPYEKEINNILTNVWDDTSKDILANKPELLRGMVEEFELGRFEMIQSIIARENALGKNKLPDLARYAQLADLVAEGKLQLSRSKPVDSDKNKKQAKSTPKTPPPKSKKREDDGDLTLEQMEKMSDAEFLKRFK